MRLNWVFALFGLCALSLSFSHVECAPIRDKRTDGDGFGSEESSIFTNFAELSQVASSKVQQFAAQFASVTEFSDLPSFIESASKTAKDSIETLGKAILKLAGVENVENTRPVRERVELNQVSAEFLNESPHRVSLWWDNDEDMHRVVDVILPGQKTSLGTYDTHVFQFTREGTRDTIGEPITIQSPQTLYKLPKDAQTLPADACTDRYKKRCKNYASQGECQKNPGWMIVNCPKSCEACELLDPRKRCDPKFLNVSAEHVWRNGDLEKMFRRILKDFAKDYDEKFKGLYATEEKGEVQNVEGSQIEYGKYDIEVLSAPPDGPWVLQFNDFLSDKEVETLLDWGEKLEYKRSTDTGVVNDRGESTKIFSQGRTSTNTWCTKACEEDPIVQNVSDRIEIITQVPQGNYEQFQLLRYEEGQFYKTHHDMGTTKDPSMAGGVRILTFFLYLSEVEEGGETDFPKLGIKVAPKKGRAILWPSVKDDGPLKQDPRTSHGALAVGKGLKFAANHWIHSHNFRMANLWGCTGAFD